MTEEQKDGQQSVLSKPEEGQPKQSVLQKRDQSVLRTPVKKVSADIVFCIDATRSMEPCIEAVKTKIKTVVEEQLPLIVGGAEANFRYRLLAFRDLVEDEIRQIEDHDFTDSVETFVDNLTQIGPGGGGDEPESMLDAMIWALRAGEADETKKFRDGVRKVLVVFTDAPSHPELAQMTVDRMNLAALGQTGSLGDAISIVDVESPMIFVAAPEKGEDGSDNAAMREIGKLPGVFWNNVANRQGLADVDMESFLKRLFESVTKDQQTRATRIVTS